MSRIDDLIEALCPDGVEQRALRDVGDWYGGGTPSRSTHEYWADGTVPWLTPKDMGAGTIRSTTDHVAERAVASSAVKLVPAGSVAFVVRSNILRRRLPVAMVPFATTMNQDMRAVVPHPDVLLGYLAQVCRARASDILAKAGRTDGSMAAVPSPSLLDFQIPIPPIAVQREISAALANMEALGASLEAEVEARLRQFAWFRETLFAFPDDVARVPMGEVGEFGRGRRFTKADVVEDGLPSIHYGEIYTRYGTATDRALSHVRADLEPALRFAEPGDVVLAAVGETVDEVGKAVAWLGDGRVAIHDDCFAYHHSLNPTYVAHYLQTVSFHSQKRRHIARGKLNRISGAGLAQVLIPTPPPEEQARIASILDKFDALTGPTGIKAEIEARQQQYAHYRARLLNFADVDAGAGVAAEEDA